MFGRTHEGTGASGVGLTASASAAAASNANSVADSSAISEESWVSTGRDHSSSGDSFDTDFSAASSAASSSRISTRSERSREPISSSGGAASTYLSSRLHLAAPPTVDPSPGSVTAEDGSVAWSVGPVADAPRRAQRDERTMSFLAELYKSDTSGIRFGDLLDGADYPDYMRTNIIIYKRAEKFKIKLPEIPVDSIDERLTTEIRFMVPSRLADAVEVDLQSRFSVLGLPVTPKVFQRKYDGAISREDGLRFGCFTYIPDEGRGVVMNYVDIKLHVTHIPQVGQMLNDYFNEIRTQAPRADIFRAESLTSPTHAPSGGATGPWTAEEMKKAWVGSYKQYLDMPEARRSEKSIVREKFYSFRTKGEERRVNDVVSALRARNTEARFLRHLKPENLRSANRFLVKQTNQCLKSEIDRHAAEVRAKQILEAEREARRQVELLLVQKRKIEAKAAARREAKEKERVSEQIIGEMVEEIISAHKAREQRAASRRSRALKRRFSDSSGTPPAGSSYRATSAMRAGTEDSMVAASASHAESASADMFGTPALAGAARARGIGDRPERVVDTGISSHKRARAAEMPLSPSRSLNTGVPCPATDKPRAGSFRERLAKENFLPTHHSRD